MAEASIVWKVLVIVIIIIALIEVFRAVGFVTRPIAIIILVLAALEAIFLFGIVGTPGTIGVTGWVLVLGTAILILAIELTLISSGIRGAPMAILLFFLAPFQLFLSPALPPL